MNWEEKAKDITEKYGINYDSFTVRGADYGLNLDCNQLFVAMKEFAKLICEKQKEVCADNAETICVNVSMGGSIVDKDSILNSPTVEM